MKSKLFALGLCTFTLSGCKELNNIDWPTPVREQLVKYNIVEPKVDPTITKEVQTVPTPDVSSDAEKGRVSSATINLPELPIQKMGETGPIFEQKITTGDDAIFSLQDNSALGGTSAQLENRNAVTPPSTPPNLFGAPLTQSQP